MTNIMNDSKDVIALVGVKDGFEDYYHSAATHRIDNYAALLIFLENYNPHVLVMGNGFCELPNSLNWIDTRTTLESVYKTFETKRLRLNRKSIQIPLVRVGVNFKYPADRLDMISFHEKLKWKYRNKFVETRCDNCKVLLEKAFERSLTIDTYRSTPPCRVSIMD